MTIALPPRLAGRTRVAALILYATAALFWLWWMSRLSLSREPTAAAGDANLGQLWPYWVLSAAMWIALTLLGMTLLEPRHAISAPATGAAGLDRNGFRRVALAVMGVATLLRLVVTATHAPGLSDDLWRYLFDGRATLAGFNPYDVAPVEIDPTAPRFPGEAQLAAVINHPHLHSVYLPVSQFIFAAGAWIADTSDSASIEHNSIVVRQIFVCFELAMVALLLRMLRDADRSAWWAALYAWHPLPLSEIAGSGHQDIVGIAFMVVALAICRRRTDAVVLWTVPLALAAAVKPVAAPLAAFALRAQRPRAWVASSLTGLAVVALLTLPFVLFDSGAAYRAHLASVREFVAKWAFNGSLFDPLLWLGVPWNAARWICTLTLAIAFIAAWQRATDAKAASRAFLFAAVLLTPTAHPWYLLWAFALWPVVPSPALWVATLTLPWSYAVLCDVVGWTMPRWMWLCVYGPIYATLIVERFASWQERRSIDGRAVR